MWKAQQRYAAHYLQQLTSVMTDYRKGGQTSVQAIERFDLDWEQIKHAQSWLKQHTQRRDIAVLCSEYSKIAFELLALRQPINERLDWLETALSAAQHLNDKSAEIEHHIQLGHTYTEAGLLDEAQTYFETAYQQAKTIRAQPEIARALTGLGEIYYTLGNYQQAGDVLSQALELSEDSLEKGSTLKLLGNVSSGLSDSDMALRHYQQALDIYETFNHLGGMAACINNLGVESYLKGNYKAAIAYYKKSSQLYQQIGDKQGEALTLSNLGDIAYYTDIGNPLAYYRSSLDIYRDIGNPHGIALVLGNMGSLLYVTNDLIPAQQCFQESLDLYQHIGDSGGIAFALSNLGVVAYQNEVYDLAIDYYHQAIAIFHDMGERFRVADVLTLMGLCEIKLTQNFAQAKSYLYQALQIAVEIEAPPIILQTITGFAWLYAYQHNERVIDLCHLVYHHPATERSVVVQEISMLVDHLSAQSIAINLEEKIDVELEATVKMLLCEKDTI